jgi:hypothetical protein
VIRRPLSGLGAVAALAIVVASPPHQTVASDELSHVPFAIGTDTLFDELRNDGRQGPGGIWTLESGRLEGDRLRLHLTIEPAPHGLPVKSGPAVLFAGIEAMGGSGDVGFVERTDALTTTVLPDCDDANCRYTIDVDLATGEIPAAIRRLKQSADLMWVSVELTLVRTFGGGTWLQVIPFGVDDGSIEGRARRMGAIEANRGTLFPFGLFPSHRSNLVQAGQWMFATRFDYGRTVERLRRDADDATTPLTMAAGHLLVDIAPRCDHAARLTLHDDAGDRAFDAEVLEESRIEGDFEIPIGIPWRLTLHDGGGIDFDQGRQGWGIRVGRIESDGSTVGVHATFDCATATGAAEVIGGVPGPPTPSAAVLIPMPTSTGAQSLPPAAASVPVADSEDRGAGPALALAGVLGLLGLVLGLVVWPRSRKSG